ncbi:MAG: hypothetical protein J1E61_04925 [Lachnospiraceae bacterium]|nr:hypothetical protein [Lachnospiraceae bacterium]
MGERSVQKNRSLGKKHGRILILACIFMLFGAVWLRKPMEVLAAAEEECGDFIVTGGTKDIDYSFGDGILQIHTDTPITIQNMDPSVPTEDRIEVEKDVDANITLAGINVDVSSVPEGDSDGRAAFKIGDNSAGNVTIKLADGTENILKSGRNHAGLEKNGESATGILTISGRTGILQAEGGPYGAGIGGAKLECGHHIVIDGGVIRAIGGFKSAGIGGGEKDAGRDITINAGDITATGGDGGAGIGGGRAGSGRNITIYGGTVTAVGGGRGAGIGGGEDGEGHDITIHDGKITATGGQRAAGIGGGAYKTGKGITINGGTVEASGVEGGAGIGGGRAGSGRNITIYGGTVTTLGIYGSGGAPQVDGGAGIGGGHYGGGDNIVISGGNVTAKGGNLAAGIGGGSGKAGMNILIDGGNVTADGGKGAAGIGGGNAGRGANIIIVGGTVAASAGSKNSDDIGNGRRSATLADSSTLVIRQNVGTVKGAVSLQRDLTIDSNVTLTVEEKAVLIIEEDVTFTNKGNIYNQGKIIILGAVSNEGGIHDQGIIDDQGNLTGSGTLDEDFPVDHGNGSSSDVAEPNTGEESYLRLYLFLALIAGTGICMIELSEKKKGKYK